MIDYESANLSDLLHELMNTKRQLLDSESKINSFMKNFPASEEEVKHMNNEVKLGSIHIIRLNAKAIVKIIDNIFSGEKIEPIYI